MQIKGTGMLTRSNQVELKKKNETGKCFKLMVDC